MSDWRADPALGVFTNQVQGPSIRAQAAGALARGWRNHTLLVTIWLVAQIHRRVQKRIWARL